MEINLSIKEAKKLVSALDGMIKDKGGR